MYWRQQAEARLLGIPARGQGPSVGKYDAVAAGALAALWGHLLSVPVVVTALGVAAVGWTSLVVLMVVAWVRRAISSAAGRSSPTTTLVRVRLVVVLVVLVATSRAAVAVVVALAPATATSMIVILLLIIPAVVLSPIVVPPTGVVVLRAVCLKPTLKAC